MRRMSPERFTQNQLTANIIRFSQLTNEHGVNNWLLRGDPQAGAIPEVYAGCFPKLYAPTGRLLIVLPVRPDIERRLNEYHQRIFNLTISEDAAKIADDSGIRGSMEAIVTRGGMPSFALVLGKSRSTGREIDVLYSIVGVSADIALREIQEGLREGVAKQN